MISNDESLIDYIKYLIEKTEIEISGKDISVKCPICGKRLEFGGNSDFITFHLSLSNHLYYCLISEISSVHLRNTVAYCWSSGVISEIRELGGDEPASELA